MSNFARLSEFRRKLIVFGKTSKIITNLLENHRISLREISHE